MRLRPDLTDGQYPKPRWTAARRKRIAEAATRASQGRKAEGKSRYGSALAPINAAQKKRRKG